MTLPENFTPSQHLKDVLIKVYNRFVKEEFKDDDDNLNINTPKSSLRTACLINKNDSQIVINNRMMLYYFCLRKASDLQVPIVGIPLDDYSEKVTFRPQITLFFKEKLEDVEKGYYQLKSQLSIRIPNETHLTITDNKLNVIANKIKVIFGGQTPLYFKRGKMCCHYHDKENGFKFQLYVFNENEGKKVIDKTLSIFGLNPNWEYLNKSQNEAPSKAFSIIPETKRILGENRKLPRKRPIGTVHFYRATAEIYGVNQSIELYSTDSHILSKYSKK